MGNICELFSNLLQNFLMIWFISNFCGYKYKGIIKGVSFSLVLIVGFSIISVINYFTDYDGLLSIISVMGFIIYAQICLKEECPMHIFVSLFSMVIVFTISSMIVLLFAIIFNKTSFELIGEFSYERLLIMCMCRLAEFGVFKFIIHIKKKYNLTYKEWGLFIIVSFFTWINVILFTRASMIAATIKSYAFGTSIIASMINIFMYYFIIRINAEGQIKTELALLKLQYDNVKSTEKNMKVLYDSTYGIKHDLEKHFLYIKTMEANGKGKDVIKYVDDILDQKLNATHKIVFTENDVFNALMNIRLEICHEKNIHPSINIESEAINEVKSEDIAVLFGNILDNAIEAAEKTNDRIIILNVQIQGDYVSIYMENSFDGLIHEELKTTKKDKIGHGIGMKNVEQIVENYNGMIKCFAEKGMFCCDILLKRNQ